MKRSMNRNFVFILTLVVLIFAVREGYSQNEKKKARVTLGFNKIMNAESYLAVSAKFKGEEGFEPASGLAFEVFNILEYDSLVHVGQLTTNAKGEGKFIFDNVTSKIADSTGTYNYRVTVSDNEEFSDVEKSIAFKEADITTELLTMDDGIKNIKATLIDLHSNTPISDQPLQLQVKRLFKPLRLGEDIALTDGSGTIIVPIDSTIPGVDGNLTLEVVLNESDEYGTVKANITGKIGTPFVNQSTFD
ncbi:MAG: hypothetical protein MUO53_10675, partial [Maribacter sp.]|nr:hypothetical protein [Maribacter sp.]